MVWLCHRFVRRDERGLRRGRHRFPFGTRSSLDEPHRERSEQHHARGLRSHVHVAGWNVRARLVAMGRCSGPEHSAGARHVRPTFLCHDAQYDCFASGVRRELRLGTMDLTGRARTVVGRSNAPLAQRRFPRHHIGLTGRRQRGDRVQPPRRRHTHRKRTHVDWLVAHRRSPHARAQHGRGADGRGHGRPPRPRCCVVSNRTCEHVVHGFDAHRVRWTRLA